jgi:uncharacterized glyoxalase superfamily protein PhnB
MDDSKRQSITPALTVNNAEAAIAYYQKAFGARLDGHRSVFLMAKSCMPSYCSAI